MRTVFVYVLSAVLLCSGACTRSGQDEYRDDEPGVIEEINKRTADEAVDYIQTPLNKARGARDAADEHTRDLESVRE